MASGTNETVTLTAELKDEMSAPLDKAIKKVDGFTDAVVDGAKKQGKATEKSTAQITSSVDKQKKAYGGLIGVFGKVGGAGSKMFDGIGRGLSKAGAGIAGRAKKLGGEIGGSIKEGLAVGGLGIASVITGAIALAGQQANSKSLLTAQMGLDPAEAKRLGGVAGKLYANGIGDGLDEINTGLEATYKSFSRFGDMSDSALAAATTQALTVAKVLGIDVTRAAQVAGTMVRNGLATDATQAFDLITAGAQQAAAGMGGDVLDALDEYSTFFTSMGFSGQEAMGMLADASHGGIMALDKIGDSIKEFGIRSTDMSATSKVAFDTLGLDQQTMANKILKGGDSAQAAFQQIIGGLLSIKDPATRANAAIGLFGTPLEDMDVTTIPSFLQRLKDVNGGLDGFSGKAQAAADTLNSGTGYEIEKFKRDALTDLQEFGVAAIPYVKPFFDFLKDSKDWLPQVAIGVGGMIGPLGALAGVLGLVAVAGWPVTLVALALGALAAAAVWAYNNVDWFKQGVDAAFKWIGEAAKNVGQWITEAFTNVTSFWQTNVQPVIDWLVNYVFRPAFDWIGRFVWNAITIIVKIFMELSSFWNTTLQPAIAVMVAWFAERLGPSITAIGKFIGDVQKGFGIFIAFLQAKFAPQIEAIKFVFSLLGDQIDRVLKGIGDFANNPLGGIQDWLGIKKDENGQGIMPTTPGASGGGVFGRFAGGGVLGGYKPGHDSILARLSPGESVLVPELTRAIGPQNIMAANAAASGGRPAGAGPSLTAGHSRRGGGSTSLSIGQMNFQVPVTAAGNVDLDQLREVVVQTLQDELNAHSRRSYR